MMDMKELGEQLRLPHGSNSEAVVDLMGKSNRSLYKFTFEQLDLFSGVRILEVGQADGHFVDDLFEVENEISYTGIDLSKEMVEMAKKNNSKHIEKGNADFIFGNVNALPFQDNSFDRIFTINTLYFWNDPEKCLKELIRVLKPKGKLFISIRSREAMEKMPFTQTGFTFYSEKELTDFINVKEASSTGILQKSETIEIPSGGKVEMMSFCAVVEKG